MYKLSYRRPGQWFWRSVNLKGQSYNGQQDRLVCEKADGTFLEIPDLSRCEVKYGQDFVNFTRASKKENASGDVPGAQE